MNKQYTLEKVTRWITLHDKLKGGVRVWFDNCGNEPHWLPSINAAEADNTLNAVRPWTEDDTTELFDIVYAERVEASKCLKSYTCVTQVSVKVEASSLEKANEIFGEMDWSIRFDGENVDFDFIGSDMITEY